MNQIINSGEAYMSEINMEHNAHNQNSIEIVHNNHYVGGAVKNGITFGSCLAMIISYTTWKSVGWAIVHGLLSWVYVIYYLIKYA